MALVTYKYVCGHLLREEANSDGSSKIQMQIIHKRNAAICCGLSDIYIQCGGDDTN